MPRAVLDAIYRVSELLAAFLFFVIFAMILIQVCLGLTDRMVGAMGGAAPGMSVPAYAEFAAYLMAAASFLGMAGALKAGAHVRVTSLLHNVPPGMRRGMETAAGLIATAASGYYCWRVGVMVHESWSFGDTSYGLVAIPMWIPQAPMAVGLGILTLAFADVTAAAARGGSPAQASLGE